MQAPRRPLRGQASQPVFTEGTGAGPQALCQLGQRRLQPRHIISAAHTASREFNGASANSVVIYQLDTPMVSCQVPAETMAQQTSQRLDAVFSMSDPANKTIILYQVYNTNSNDTLVVNGGGKYCQ
jgi:molybdopterin-guanine dinucleotide biosynthesis protein A